jgi:hypothetical protein
MMGNKFQTCYIYIYIYITFSFHIIANIVSDCLKLRVKNPVITQANGRIGNEERFLTVHLTPLLPANKTSSSDDKKVEKSKRAHSETNPAYSG